MKKTHGFCSLPFTKLIINAWGDVVSCCHHSGNRQLGNIQKDDLLEIWKSQELQDTRWHTENNILAPPCFNAPNCPFHLSNKNQFEIEYSEEYPAHIEIDLPDKHCNIGGLNPTPENPACIMCVRNHSFPYDQPDLTNLICEKVKPLIPYLKFFSVLGIAEPFWKGAVFDIFEKVGFSKHKHKITFDTNNNATCFGNSTQDRFLREVDKSKLFFSLDAASSDTYKKIRRIDGYDLCIKNIQRWNKVKNPEHHVYIWNNINLLNVNEMTKMVQTALELDVEAIYMLPTQNQNNKVNLGDLIINQNNLSVFKENSEKAMEFAQKYGVNLIYTTPFDKLPPSNFHSKLTQIDFS